MPNKFRCCITERSCAGIIGDVGDDAAIWRKNIYTVSQLPFSENIKQIAFQQNRKTCLKYIQKARVRPFVGESVFVRGTVIWLGSPIRYEGR